MLILEIVTFLRQILKPPQAKISHVFSAIMKRKATVK